ncbi:hypothetical protein V1505DRAFT_357688 [Lipomyces doorenjongii]
MQGVSECPPILNFDLPPPLRLAFIDDIEGPQNTYGHSTTFTLRATVGDATVVIRIKKHLRVRKSRHSQIPYDDAPEELKQVVTNHFSAQEAAAYLSLSSIQGTVVPVFYGEFACHFADRPVESDQTVKVLLIEYIDGWPLSWYSPGELTESQAHWIAVQTEAIKKSGHVLNRFAVNQI